MTYDIYLCQVPHRLDALGLCSLKVMGNPLLSMELDLFVFLFGIRSRCAPGLLGWPSLVLVLGGGEVGGEFYKS